MTTEVRLIPSVPPEFWAAYNLTPNDLTLVGAMADAAAENGDNVTADFLGYMRMVGQYPEMLYGGKTVGWKDPLLLAGLLWNKTPPYKPYDTAANALWRVWCGWQRLSLVERQGCWSLLQEQNSAVKAL